MKKIQKKIVGFEVITEEKKAQADTEKPEITQQRTSAFQTYESIVQEQKPIAQTHEPIERPERLIGSTYKIKTPLSEHAMYVTINDMLLNEGTEHEQRRPFEVFIDSKNMETYQWIMALTLLISAMFRKGGDIALIVNEFSTIFDPRGGYFKPDGKFMPSLVAEIGDVLTKHLKIIGIIASDGQRKSDKSQKEHTSERHEGNSFTVNAQFCKKCNTKSEIIMDGCPTCVNCGDSKCS